MKKLLNFLNIFLKSSARADVVGNQQNAVVFVWTTENAENLDTKKAPDFWAGVLKDFPK